MLPMLGMYFNGSIEWSASNFQRKQSSPSTTETHLNQNEFVYELTSTQKLSMFPQTHDYMTPSGKVIKQYLFGKSIVLVDHILVKKQVTVGCFPFYVAYVFLRRRHQMALEAVLDAMEHPFLIMSAAHTCPQIPGSSTLDG